jgi:acetyltransferase-like isoleucine patch superfamily enzyme
MKATLGTGTFVGKNVKIVGRGSVTIGDYTKIHDGCFINVPYDDSYVTIGHNCWFGQNCVIDGTGGLEIRNNVGVGIASHIYTHIAHGDTLDGCRFFSKKTTIIDDDAWIVGQCLISPVYIAKKSMIMLGSVVTKDTNPNRIYAGVPAKDITDAMGGPPWVDKSADVKMAEMQNLIKAYCEENRLPEHPLKIRVCSEYPSEMEPEYTYFNVSDRTYTKLNTLQERDFMVWLTSYRGRFIPRIQ